MINSWTIVNKDKSTTIIESELPPLRDIEFNHDNSRIKASPFKIPRSSNEHDSVIYKDISSLQQQNNYSNKLLHVINQKLEKLDRIIESRKYNPHLRPEDRNLDPKIPIFKPAHISSKNLLSLGKNDSLLQRIEDKLASLNQESSSNITVINKTEKDNKSIESDSEDLPSEEFVNQLQDEPLVIAKYHGLTPRPKTRNYYGRPTPPDVQYEERSLYTQAQYNGESIYEWNIDGMAEMQIINNLQEMIMASLAYKAKSSNNTDQKIANMIIAGFTGQLKGWWDNFLHQSDRLAIIHAIKTDPDSGQTEQDAVNTLIFAITKHFIGEPLQYQQRASILLSTITCPKMTDFRWYKDVFLSKLYTRVDCNNSYWKERFISGLPRLFADKVRENIKVIYNGDIPYNILTYGEIINIVNNTALNLCNDYKLANKLKKEQSEGRRELGSWCSQFGYESIQAPSSKKNRLNRNLFGIGIRIR